MRRPHRALAAGAILSVSAALTLGTVLHAAATGPSGAALPDFTGGVPYQEQAVYPKWGFAVTTSGLGLNDQITFKFLYKGQIGDPLHSVTFIAHDLTRTINVYNYPASVPVPGCGNVNGHPLPAPGGVGLVQPPQAVTAATADPYAQTITFTSPGRFQSGTGMLFCFDGQQGGYLQGPVAFPVAVDANSQYSIEYAEPGGVADAAYSVSQQVQTTSNVTDVFDGSGREVTGAGFDRTAPALMGATYSVKLSGSAASTYTIVPRDFFSPDGKMRGTVDIEGLPPSVPNPACSVGRGTFCTDATGKATGTIKVTVPDTTALPEMYVTFDVTDATGATNEAISWFSTTFGMPNAPPPTPAPTATPPPGGGGGGPTPPPVHCVGGSNTGLGSTVVSDLNRVLLPAFQAGLAVSCQRGQSMSVEYTDSNDTVALNSLFNGAASYGDDVFAGLDRALSLQEYNTYSPPNSNGRSASFAQLPLALQPLSVTYNLAGCTVSGTVTLSPADLDRIFTGKTPSWSTIVPGCSLPILVAEDVGTASTVLKTYLSRTSGDAAWAAYTQGPGASSWPAGVTPSCWANGSEAMALCVRGRPGMIGYGAYSDITRAGLPSAFLGAASAGGASAPVSYTGDPLTGCTTAAAGLPTVPTQTTDPTQDWSTAWIVTNPTAGYAVCWGEFLVVPTQNAYEVPLGPLCGYMQAVYADSTQAQLPALGYSPLPPAWISTGLAAVEATNGKRPVLQC